MKTLVTHNHARAWIPCVETDTTFLSVTRKSMQSSWALNKGGASQRISFVFPNAVQVSCATSLPIICLTTSIIHSVHASHMNGRTTGVCLGPPCWMRVTTCMEVSSPDTAVGLQSPTLCYELYLPEAVARLLFLVRHFMPLLALCCLCIILSPLGLSLWLQNLHFKQLLVSIDNIGLKSGRVEISSKVNVTLAIFTYRHFQSLTIKLAKNSHPCRF